MESFILDPCCGGRAFYFKKADPSVLFMDIREYEGVCSDGRNWKVKPDLIGDFRDMPFPDKSFKMVVFDPPHFIHTGDTSWLRQKYGSLSPLTWKEDLLKGFKESMRVLEDNGFLVFKWNAEQIKIKDVLSLFGETPLFGDKRSKTFWLIFVKKPQTQEVLAKADPWGIVLPHFHSFFPKMEKSLL